MAIAHVQTVGAATDNTTSATTAAITTTAGNLLHINASYFGALSSLTDSKGNTWVPCGAEIAHPGGGNARQFYAKNCLGGASHTFTLALTGNGWPTLSVTEISGCDTAAPLDQVSGQLSPSSSATHTSGNITTTVADTILVGLCGSPETANGYNNDAQYVQRYNQDTTATAEGLLTSTKILAATATIAFQPDTNSTIQAITMLASYKIAAGGGGGVDVVITVPVCRDVFV